MTDDLRARLRIPGEHLEALNEVLLAPGVQVIDDMLDVVARYGSPEEINRKAEEARALPNLLERVKAVRPEHLADLAWLEEQRERGTFISVDDYRRRVLGDQVDAMTFRDASAVTLEISACQYFPWLMEIAARAVADGDLVPGRFIRVRNMVEQEADGDLPAFAAAMQIIGASWVEQLDTRGADGANIHLGGPDTLVGYYGGVGEPNDYPLKWLDEFLTYYTNYGVREILNVNAGTTLVAYLLHRLGVDIAFKISVTMGNDNPYSALWTLLTAKLFARDDGTTPLVGFNWSNSVTVETIENAAQFRKALGLEDAVRFEHHVTETWKGIVIQPYSRREDVVELAERVVNISAKHEGGDPEVEAGRERPSDIEDYFREKDEIVASGEWADLTLNFHDKFDAVNRTARALTERGLSFVAARHLHHRDAESS